MKSLTFSPWRTQVVWSSFLLIFALYLSGCATGKKAFQAGDFARAAEVAAGRLAKDPENEKAAAIFLAAYPLARQEALEKLRWVIEDEEDPFRWERSLENYEALRRLSSYAALTPFGAADGIEIDYHFEASQAARERAVETRESMGDALLDEADMIAAREAYGHFSRALQLAASSLPRVQAKLERARDLGTLRVALLPATVNGHGMHAGLLDERLFESLMGQRIDTFVLIVPSEEMDTADMSLELRAGEMSLREDGREVEKEGYRRVIPLRDGEREVFAWVYTREKQIRASCSLQVQLFDENRNEVALNRSMHVYADWRASWQIVEGDLRAIDEEALYLEEPETPSFSLMADLLSERIVDQAWHTLEGYF